MSSLRFLQKKLKKYVLNITKKSNCFEISSQGASRNQVIDSGKFLM